MRTIFAGFMLAKEKATVEVRAKYNAVLLAFSLLHAASTHFNNKAINSGKKA